MKKAKKKREFLFRCVNRHNMNQAYDSVKGLLCPKCYEKHVKMK